MRRKEKEITDILEIKNILSRCKVCRLAMYDGSEPYIVPMNFGFEFVDDIFILYFHSATSGKKLDILKNNPIVAFETDGRYKLITDDDPCGYGFKFESVIGVGNITFIENIQLKERALTILMNSFSDDKAFEFNKNILEKVCVFSLELTKITAKSSYKNLQ